MLDIKFVRENIEAIEAKIRERNLALDLSHFVQLDGDRRRLLRENDDLRNKRNKATQKIAELKRVGEDPSPEIKKMKKVAQKIKNLDDELRKVNEAIERILLEIPNIPHPSVPFGTSKADNVLVRTWGEPPQFDFEPKAHWQLGEELGELSFSRAVKTTGSRFSMIMGRIACLGRALINFMLDTHTKEHGYVEVSPPYIVNRQALYNSGYLPNHERDLFRLRHNDFFLIPSGEVPLTNMFRGENFDEQDLPLSFVAATPCFRKEAGSWGKDTRGLMRQHQFDKVQLIKLVRSEDSYDELEKVVRDTERILQLLELPHQVVELCTSELSFTATKCYDVELWIPSQQRFREVSTCSNFEDFQARRADIRYKTAESVGSEFVHTVNGSAVAIGRTLVAILENFQQSDGSIHIPRLLQPYMGGVEKIAFS